MAPDNLPICIVCRDAETPDNKFYSNCKCRGTTRIHKVCIREYLSRNQNISGCPNCHTPFEYKVITKNLPWYIKLCGKIKCVEHILPAMLFFMFLLLWIITFILLHTVNSSNCVTCYPNMPRKCENIINSAFAFMILITLIDGLITITLLFGIMFIVDTLNKSWAFSGENNGIFIQVTCIVTVVFNIIFANTCHLVSGKLNRNGCPKCIDISSYNPVPCISENTNSLNELIDWQIWFSLPLYGIPLFVITILCIIQICKKCSDWKNKINAISAQTPTTTREIVGI